MWKTVWTRLPSQVLESPIFPGRFSYLGRPIFWARGQLKVRPPVKRRGMLGHDHRFERSAVTPRNPAPFPAAGISRRSKVVPGRLGRLDPPQTPGSCSCFVAGGNEQEQRC